MFTFGDRGGPPDHSLCTESGLVQNLNREFQDIKKHRSKLCSWAGFLKVYKILVPSLLSHDLKKHEVNQFFSSSVLLRDLNNV